MTDIWKELDLDRWTWEVPRDTPGPYVAEHIPKPLITNWVKKWKPIINEALEKADKLEAIKNLFLPLPEWIEWEFNTRMSIDSNKMLSLREILEGEPSSEVTQA